MRKIGIMGGTFNPIHIGHLMLAEWALDAVGLNAVWFIPTGVSYMKESTEIVSGTERLHMTELAVKDNVYFKCMDIEINREGYTYSYETLEQLKSMYPDDEFFFIVGADCLFAIESWKCPERIFASCTLIAAVRGDVALSEMEEKKLELERRFNGSLILLPFISMSVSSTGIRQRIREGKSVRYLLPDCVIAYIKEKGLYREEEYEKAEKSNEKGTRCQEI